MSYQRLPRFRKQITQFVLLSIFYLLLSALSYAQSISSTELINKAKDYDGKAISYEGELIGDIMSRGEYAWINVNDGQNAIGIWLEKSLVKEVVYTGSYKARGDHIEVRGIFHRACPVHGGDLDIHAEYLLKIKEGATSLQGLNAAKKKIAIYLLGVLCLLWILRQLKHR